MGLQITESASSDMKSHATISQSAESRPGAVGHADRGDVRRVTHPLLRHLLPFAPLLLLIPLAPALLAILRVLDSGICAQLPTHTLAPGGIPLPLCARNTGIYSGAALGFGILWAQGRRRAMLPPAAPVLALLLAAIGLMGIDGINSVATDLQLPHLYTPSNALRLATGLAAGAALALLLAPVMARACYGPVDLRPPVPRLADLAPCAIGLLAAFPLIWSTASWTLYPVAFLSNAGLFAILAGANLIALDALRRSRRLPGPPAIPSWPVLRLLLVCAAELSVLAVLRSLLLGPGMA